MCDVKGGGGYFFSVTMTLSVEFSFGDAPLSTKGHGEIIRQKYLLPAGSVQEV